MEIQIAYKDDNGQVEVLETDKLVTMIGGSNKEGGGTGGFMVMGEYSIPELMQIQDNFGENMMMLITTHIAKMSGANLDDIKNIIKDAPIDDVFKESFVDELKNFMDD